jgi:beta-glucuronidase
MLLGTPHRRRSRSRAAAGAANRRLTSAAECSDGSRGPARLVAATPARRGRGLLVALAAAAALLMALGSAPAGAQPVTPYAATPPTYGALYQDGPSDRWLLGGTWLFRADPGDLGVAGGWWRDLAGTTGWSPVAVPNSYNAADLSSASMNGSVGWYRRDFTVPRSAFAGYVPARFRSWIVRFESVNYRATVWLNGRRIGTHSGAYLPFELDLSNVRSGINRLVVRVDDRRSSGDLPPGPSGGWWNFGGLQREVYLRPVQRADMPVVQVRPILPCPTCAATIQEQVSVRNVTGVAETVVLQGAYGGAALDFGAKTIAGHQTWTARAAVTIPIPHLWAPDDPYLYRASLTLTDAHGRKLEGYVTESGIRSITVAPTGQLLLNGRVLNLRGFSIHEQNLQTGAALSPVELAALVGWTRELGGTIIRAHYPLNPLIEEMADRDGILLWSEVPVYQVQSKYLARPSWLTAAHAILRQNILTNQNHPSVLLWSIGNELPTPPTDSEAQYISGATQLAHQLDPTRPVGMAISDWPGVACQAAYAPLDVIGFNDYFGWFDAGGGATDDPDALSPFLDSLHACYPSKSLMITEFGFEGNRNGPVEERGTFQNQAASAAFHLGVFASKPYISAAMWFALQDFAAHPGWGGGDPLPNPPIVQKGEIDINGNPRQPLFSTIQSIYQSTVQIAPAVAALSRRGHRVRLR